MNINKSDQNVSVWLPQKRQKQQLTSVSDLYYNHVHKLLVKLISLICCLIFIFKKRTSFQSQTSLVMIFKGVEFSRDMILPISDTTELSQAIILIK